VVRLFRPDRHVARMQRTAELLCLPVPDEALLTEMLHTAVAANLEVVPDPPGALYLRPLLIGTEPNIGAAAAPSGEALLVVLASPVGDYFTGGGRALQAARGDRAAPHDAPVRRGEGGGELRHGARGHPPREGGPRRRPGPVRPGRDVQETGAANFLLLDEERVVTRALDRSFLHGITRDTVLTLGA
jgi:branched-chain amino acid aminotransferase